MAPRVWTLGEGLAVLMAQGPGPAEHASQLEVGVGGAELNVAIGLSRLGHGVTWVGVVGADPWGRRIVRELQAEGVKAAVRITGQTFTGAYLRERRTRGLVRATYLRRGAAGAELTVADVVDALTMDENDVLHLTGVTPALSECARDAWVSAAAMADEHGCLVSLDINYRSALTSARNARTSFDLVRHHTRLVMASPDEVAVVSGREDELTPEQAAHVLQELVTPGAEVVVKDGANGSLHLAADGSTTRSPAVSVQVEDLVGAGDAFAAGYLSGLLDDLPVPDRLSRGHACAAFVVASRGDWEGAPRRAELELARSLAEVEVHR